MLARARWPWHRLRQVRESARSRGRLIGRSGPPSRFSTADVFATYAGVASIEVALGGRTRLFGCRVAATGAELGNHLIAVPQVLGSAISEFAMGMAVPRYKWFASTEMNW